MDVSFLRDNSVVFSRTVIDSVFWMYLPIPLMFCNVMVACSPFGTVNTSNNEGICNSELSIKNTSWLISTYAPVSYLVWFCA